MQPEELGKRLLNYTVANSGAEHRAYLGMSAIGQCRLALYRAMVYGRPWTTQQHLYCERGYAAEQRVLLKLAALDGLDITTLPVWPYPAFRTALDALIARRETSGLLGPAREYSDMGGRFLGHTDGSWDGDLLEIKSTTGYKLAQINGRIPDQNYWQVQTYLHYGRYRRALVVYLAVDTNQVKVVPVRYNENVAEMACLKAAEVLEAVDHRQPPGCDCGRCEAEQGENTAGISHPA